MLLGTDADEREGGLGIDHRRSVQRQVLEVMDRYLVVVHYADGAGPALGTDARTSADARQEIIRRLVLQSSSAEADYCPACLDDRHTTICPNLTRTGM